MRPIQATLLAATIAAAGAFLPQVASAASNGYTTATVNLRSGPSTGYGVVTSVPAGSRITVFSCTSWCNVDWRGIRGWMSARYVSGGGYVAPPPPPPRYYNPYPSYPPVYVYPEYRYPDYRSRPPMWRPNPWDHKPPKWDGNKPPKWDGNKPPKWDNPNPPKWDGNKPPPKWDNNKPPPKWDNNKPPPNWNNNNPKPWQNGNNDHPKQPQTFVPSDAAPGRPYCRLEDGKTFCN